MKHFMYYTGTILALVLLAGYTSASGRKMSEPSFNIINYNIRMNTSADGGNAWPLSKEKVAGLLKFHKADIFNVQEALPEQIDDLVKAFPDFDHVGAGRDDGKREGPKDKGNKIRILSYNIHNCIGTDGITDYKRVASIISHIDPDVAAIQEIDSCTIRSNGVFILDQLAVLTGMHAVFAPSITYQGGKYGIGMLSKEIPIGWRKVTLPGREEQRSLLIVEFVEYTVCCTHFSLNEEDRLASAKIINKEFDGNNKLVFLAGDINAVPSSDVMKCLSGSWTILNDPEVPTIPSEKPERCIDYILGLRSGDYLISVDETRVEPESLASDHLPVWAEINFE